MNEAIKLAIEKGYHLKDTPQNWENDLVLDPLFWQALGKGLGWTKTCCSWCGTETNAIYPDNGGLRDGDCNCHMRWTKSIPTWLYEALRYHELNLTGGDTEKFWKELLHPLKPETKTA